MMEKGFRTGNSLFVRVTKKFRRRILIRLYLPDISGLCKAIDPSLNLPYPGLSHPWGKSIPELQGGAFAQRLTPLPCDRKRVGVRGQRAVLARICSHFLDFATTLPNTYSLLWVRCTCEQRVGS